MKDLELRIAGHRLQSEVEGHRDAKEMLERSYRAIKAAYDSKMEFLAQLSHEIRNPLSGMIGFAEMIELAILGQNQEARYQEYAGHIRQAGAHLLELTNDILEFSKAEAGRIELQRERFLLSEVISECLTLAEEQALRKEVHLENRCAGSTLALVADPLRIKQVVINLLTNAIKFTPPGRVARVVEI